MMVRNDCFPKGRTTSYTLVFFILLIVTRCFDLIILNNNLCTLLGATLLAFFYFSTKENNSHYKLWIGLIELLILGSVFYSFLVNEQSFKDVFLVSYFAFGLASFFIFSYFKISYKNSIKIIKSFSLLFCIAYIFQWIVYPTEIFSGVRDTFSVNESQFRMRMSCSACSYCLFFWGLNDYMISKKLINLLYVLLGILPFMIMGFRSLVFLSILFAIYIVAWHLWKSKSHFFVYTFFLLLFVFVIIQVPIVQDKYEEMISRQESEQTFDNEDYVRYVSLAYYTDVTTKTEMAIGGGFPLVPKSLSSGNHYVSKFCKGFQMQLYWNDLGLIGFGFIFGFPSVILITFLVFRTALRSKEKQLLFIRATLLTIYLGSIFTSQELYRAGNFLFIGLLMYTEYIYHKEKNENRNINFSLRS